LLLAERTTACGSGWRGFAGHCWPLLLAELLLAAAEGKLPEEGTAAVPARARAMLDDAGSSSSNEPHELGLVELGYILSSNMLRIGADEAQDAEPAEARAVAIGAVAIGVVAG
jgi:hypothetical protein